MIHGGLIWISVNTHIRCARRVVTGILLTMPTFLHWYVIEKLIYNLIHCSFATSALLAVGKRCNVARDQHVYMHSTLPCVCFLSRSPSYA